MIRNEEWISWKADEFNDDIKDLFGKFMCPVQKPEIEIVNKEM